MKGIIIMKLTIKRSVLLELVESVYEAIPPQSSDPCYKNYLLTISNSGIDLLGSDGSLSILGHLDLNQEGIINYEFGAVQIPAKYLADIVRKLVSDVLTLELIDESLLYISNEDSQFRLNINKAEEYPDIDMTLANGEELNLKFKDFLKLYNSTSFAVATKGPKELYCGINIQARDNKLTFAATDSFRLARRYVPLEGDYHISLTVPSKTLAIVSHFGEFEDISIKVDSSKVLFKIGNYVISSKIYNGEFPNVDRFVPVATSYLLNVNSKEFLNTIDLITSVGNEKMLINANTEKVEVSSKDLAVGSSKAVLKDAKFTGEVFSIIFNANFVREAIKAMDSERVTLAFTSESRSFLVKNDDVTITQVITPIRTMD